MRVMSAFALTLALAACGKPAPPAPPPPPAPVVTAAPADEVVQRVRAATGEVRVRSGSVERRGVGFVVSVGEKHAHVVTDANVTGKAQEGRTATVTFGERVAPAVVAHEDGTWAVLRVERAGETALTLAVSESESVFVGAFGPEGFALRATRWGRSERNAWLDDEQDPAAAGAPIVDVAGRLVGMLAGARSSSERLKRAHPLAALLAFLDPHVIEPSAKSGHDPFGEWGVIVRARLVDPAERVREAHVGLGPSDRTSAEARPAPGGGYAPVLGDAKMHPMACVDGAVMGHAAVSMGSYVWQLRLTLKDGSTRFGPPGRVRVDEAVEPVDPAAPDTSGLPRPLAGVRRVAGEAQVVPVKLEAKDVVPHMVWSPDGEHVFVLETAGVVRKIAVPALREVARVTLRATAGSMALSREGLVVGHLSEAMISVVELDDLAVAHRIEVENSTRVASARALPVAFSTGPGGHTLEVVDIVDGRSLVVIPARYVQLLQQANGIRGGNLVYEFGNVVCTPDGRFLLCTSGGTLHRLSIGEEFDHEEAGSTTLFARLDVSSDSKYVASRAAAVHDPRTGTWKSGVQLFEVVNLRSPTVTIDCPATESVFGYDVRAGRVYIPRSGSGRVALAAFSFLGEAGSTIVLDSEAAEVRQILAHPDGHRLLVLTARGLYWVETKR